MERVITGNLKYESEDEELPQISAPEPGIGSATVPGRLEHLASVSLAYSASISRTIDCDCGLQLVGSNYLGSQDVAEGVTQPGSVFKVAERMGLEELIARGGRGRCCEGEGVVCGRFIIYSNSFQCLTNCPGHYSAQRPPRAQVPRVCQHSGTVQHTLDCTVYSILPQINT
ncbi:hypothetical protein J6590_040117 [Homalodisca vitripennis]|nr:hypothetical protein J6590_040117 [Homalodisca vitripennis]